jgi:hypothetical protein
VGRAGSALVTFGRCPAALKSAGVPAIDIQQFLTEAGQGDYKRPLAMCRQLVGAQ